MPRRWGNDEPDIYGTTEEDEGMSSSPELDAILMPTIERWNDKFICTGMELGERVLEVQAELDRLGRESAHE